MADGQSPLTDDQSSPLADDQSDDDQSPLADDLTPLADDLSPLADDLTPLADDLSPLEDDLSLSSENYVSAEEEFSSLLVGAQNKVLAAMTHYHIAIITILVSLCMFSFCKVASLVIFILHYANGMILT